MKDRALSLLKLGVGQDSKFRENQWEAIEVALSGKKALIVEKTGWGKSIVYFIATKLLREQGRGITLLISPLLSLMRNQIDAAEKIGLRALTINSNNKEEWNSSKIEILNGNCDILLISPERLANDEFRTDILNAISIDSGIGMVVVDEAHCISDWGHDFRPDYRRIVRITKNLPANVPLIATTATANNRVVDDIKQQLGEELISIRGPLLRESLKEQVIKLEDQAERLAWLYENLNKIPGSGIIYCATKKDCNTVAGWLRHKGINALEYHTSLSSNSASQAELERLREDKLMNNEIKALVGTVKIGMGYDKPDLGFVIHYQSPGSLIAYYQQIGRAGRKLNTAFTILLNGKEDEEIQRYFIESAFPGYKEMEGVLKVIEYSEKGITKNQLYKMLNMSNSRINKCLKSLEIDMVITREKDRYSRTPILWQPDYKRSASVTAQRYKELEKMKEFIDYQDCYMKFISRELDDPIQRKCNRCSNCEGINFFPDSVENENVLEAIEFLKKGYIVFSPRKRWPAGILGEKSKTIAKEYQNEEGRALCNYGDAGWGKYVKEDKYTHGYFREELVERAFNLMVNDWQMINKPNWVTSVPSLRRPELVKSFAKRLAKRLGIPYVEAIIKIEDTKEQKHMKNSYQQSYNAIRGFKVLDKVKKGPVLLVDDMVDSKWTLTICGAMLKKAGVEAVYPFAIASTAEGGLD